MKGCLQFSIFIFTHQIWLNLLYITKLTPKNYCLGGYFVYGKALLSENYCASIEGGAPGTRSNSLTAELVCSDLPI